MTEWSLDGVMSLAVWAWYGVSWPEFYAGFLAPVELVIMTPHH